MELLASTYDYLTTGLEKTIEISVAYCPSVQAIRTGYKR